MVDAPEPWQTTAPGPFLTIGEVALEGIGTDRYRITWPGDEREVEGFDKARALAHEPADHAATPSRS